MRIFVFSAIFLLLSFYGFQAVKTLTGNKWVRIAFIGMTLLIVFNFVIRMLMAEQSTLFTGANAYALGFFLAWASAQLVLLFFLFSEDIVRVLVGLFSKQLYQKGEFHLPSRRKFLAQVGLGIAAIPFASLLYGMYRGKYNFKVLRYELEFEDLPEAFDGYQLTQISDIHCGSFDNREKIKYGVDLIKNEKSDVVFFTGDLVNNLAKETDDWKDLFGSIKAQDGVFSVLGNHDYGDYYQWDSLEGKKKNLQKIKDAHQEMGWDLLLNEHRTVKRGEQALHIVGVENWGSGRFPKYGDLKKASNGLTPDDFKVLLTHDPSHWEEHVQENPENFQLTLSGHTHGMQFGIEIPGIVKWSPIKYRYKYWAGVYKEFGRYLNVNRGFGYLAYPGRVGMWPEITVIRLKKKEKNTV